MEIAEGVSLSRPALSQVLLALHGAGLIERPWRGVYRIPVKEPLALPAARAAAQDHQPTEEPHETKRPRRETSADRLRRMQQARSGGVQ
jgi:hypothetical protein